jgi:hypothetical protein
MIEGQVDNNNALNCYPSFNSTSSYCTISRQPLNVAMSTVWLRELCLLLVFLLQNATIIHSTEDSGDAVTTTMTEAATRNNNATTATVLQQEEAYGLLRGSSISVASIQHMERIIDKDAIAALNGADPSLFVFHPPGHEANFWDYPYFAHWTHAECGATVVHDDILLTAGHVSSHCIALSICQSYN